MMSQTDVSIRDVADLVHIDPLVLARLCRYLHIDCREQRVPLHVVERAGKPSQPEERYAVLRSWLLGH